MTGVRAGAEALTTTMVMRAALVLPIMAGKIRLAMSGAYLRGGSEMLGLKCVSGRRCRECGEHKEDAQENLPDHLHDDTSFAVEVIRFGSPFIAFLSPGRLAGNDMSFTARR